MTRSTDELQAWSQRPLCRRYARAVFDVAIARSGNRQDATTRRMIWGFGWLADGECEPLGAWVDRPPDVAHRVIANLRSRGVQRLARFIGPLEDGVFVRVGGAFASRLLEVRTGRTVVDVLSGAAEPDMAAAMVTADQVRAGLVQTLRRRGRCDSDVAAWRIVASHLRLVERRLDRSRRASIAAQASAQTPS